MTDHDKRIANHRLDSVGRLYQRYATHKDLLSCWSACVKAGVPADAVNPAGASDQRIPSPEDSYVSEHVLRAFEAYRGEGPDEFPPLGFKADLRAIADNLDMTARLLVEYYGLAELTEEQIPLKWLKTAAEFAWYRAEDPRDNPLVKITREFAGDSRYEIIPALWAAWYAPGIAPLERLPQIGSWDD